jgi:uncharacterized protein YceK
MRNKIIYIIVLVVLMVGFSGCSTITKVLSEGKKIVNEKKAEEKKTIISDDGKIQVTTPASWKKATDLNDKAELQIEGGDSGAMYLIVLAESKKEFADDIKSSDHYDLVLKNLEGSLENFKEEELKNIVINGNDSTQGIISGEYDKMKSSGLSSSGKDFKA